MNAGIIVLSGGKDGDVGQALLSGDQELSLSLLNFWQNYFPERFYFELTRTGKEREEQYICAVLNIASEQKIPVVATNAVRFLVPEDFEAHEARVCIHDGNTLSDASRPHLYTEQQFLRTPVEMAELFADIPEALINSVNIAKRCTIELVLDKTF